MTDGGIEPVEVIVKLSPEAAAPDSPQHEAVHARAAELGIPLEPLYASTSDPDLATYAVAHVDPAAAKAVVEQLLATDGVEGAYAKARGAAPERSAYRVQQPS